jgi:LAGLIDADG endonuclease
MNDIKTIFNCGIINETDKSVRFTVTNIDDINKIIIPFFFNYYLQGSKFFNFKIFVKISDFMKNKAHLTQEGLDKKLIIKAGMNKDRELNKKSSLFEDKVFYSVDLHQTTLKNIKLKRPFDNNQV